jgi:uncharacterized protein
MGAADLLSESPASTAAPVAAGERLLTLDVLRGIALLGVLVANVWYWFSGLYLRFAELRPRLTSLTPDAAAHHLVSVLVSGKAFAIFSFLFGVGLAVQAMRAETRGADVAPLYRRRLAVLLAIGLTHGVLLWYGDILTAYALMGFVLLLCRRWSDRALLASAAVLLVVVPIAFTAYTFATREPPPAAAPGAAAALVAQKAAEQVAKMEAFRSLDPARIVPQNLAWIRATYFGPVVMQILPPVLGLFFLGLWAGRRRAFERTAEHAAAFRRITVWGLGVGLPVVVAVAVAGMAWGAKMRAVPWLPPAITVVHEVAVLAMAAGYVAATVLLLERAAWRGRLAAFAPVGRMALTHYLSQTVICIAIFYGGGLIGRVGPAAALAIALAVFAAQMAVSPWWLARFHFGPVEWLWRSLTYGRPQPMRIRAPAVRPGLA